MERTFRTSLILLLPFVIAACGERTLDSVADASPDGGMDVGPGSASDAADASGPAADTLAERPEPDARERDFSCANTGFGPISPVDCARCGQPTDGQFVCPPNLDECGQDLVDRDGCSAFGICSHCLTCRSNGSGWEWGHASAQCHCAQPVVDAGVCLPPDGFKCHGAFITDEECNRCGDAPKTPANEPFLACPPDVTNCGPDPSRCRAARAWGYCWKCDGSTWRKTTVTSSQP